MTATEKAQLLMEQAGKTRMKVRGICQDETGQHSVTLRLFKSQGGTIGYHKKGSRKMGYPLYDMPNLVDVKPITTIKSNEQKWIDGWTKVKNTLERSGLWTGIAREIDDALDIGHAKLKDAYDKYWQIHDEQQRIDILRKIHPKLITYSDDGRMMPNTNLIWHYVDNPRVKKMRFGKGEHNEYLLAKITSAIANKTAIRESGRTSYDVSFQYKPEVNRAWYAEEYKGCGNGHYYLAMNASHALHYEDD